MILYKLIFGATEALKLEKAADLIENYIATLLHNGQACGEYFTVLQNGNLCAYLSLQGVEGNSDKYHCHYGRERLKEVSEFFGLPPTWEIIDDEVPKRDETWSNAPFLFLASDKYDWDSPNRRGDNGIPIPMYILPGEHEDREMIYFWQRSYLSHDNIWMECGKLEIATYKEIATPTSELALRGRDACAYIEKVTGIPTYYYLMRYWGRRESEEFRKFPGCGEHWTLGSNHELDKTPLHTFDFLCEPCRLVSHVSNACDDERHAVIGE